MVPVSQFPISVIAMFAKMNGELDRDRFEIMNDELCWGIIDFRMLFTGFLALIIDLFADLTVEILFFAGSAGSLAGFSLVYLWLGFRR